VVQQRQAVMEMYKSQFDEAIAVGEVQRAHNAHCPSVH
jgi:hypothetical protein